MAREAILMPMFPKSSGHSILHISSTLCAHPVLRAVLVIGLAILDDVLSGDTFVAPGTREEVSCAILAMWLS